MAVRTSVRVQLLAVSTAVMWSLGLSGCGQSTEAPETPVPSQLTIWGERALLDIQAGHQMMLENHPGPVDTENPKFGAVAETALQDGLALAKTVQNAQDYRGALDAYSAFYRDGHFGLIPNDAYWEELEASTDNWPGVLIGWRNSVYSVVHSEVPTEIGVGDILLSCDGKSADDLMMDNVFRFKTNGPELESHFALAAFEILHDRGNTLIERPKVCIFLKEGEAYSHTLNWQPWPEEARYEMMDKALFGSRPATGVQDVAPGVFWINLPVFNPQGEAEDLNNLIAELEANAEMYRGAKAIVFDVRSNNGGNSIWGRRVLTAIYGKAYYEARTYYPGVEVHWRAVQGSIDKIEGYKAQYTEQGNNEGVENLDKLAKGMRAAKVEGKAMYVEASNHEAQPPEASNPVSAQVFLLTHGWCASACLDFADDVYAMEGTRHIGYPTAADSLYMDVRVETLPSGYGAIILPMKVYRNRKRGNGENYTPEITYNEFGWSDKKLHDWFLSDVFEDEAL